MPGQNVAVEIALAEHLIFDQRQLSDTEKGELLDHVMAEASAADHRHVRIAESNLPVRAEETDVAVKSVRHFISLAA